MRPAEVDPHAASRRAQRLALLAILIVVVGSLAAGSWWGFPVQDDTYMIRLVHLGGPSLVRAEHPDRLLVGLLMAAGVRLAGEHRLFYVSVGLLSWLLLAAETALLWVRLFPRWSSAWPVAGLAAVAPVVAQVQYTSLTTILPCLLPVILVLAATLILLAPDPPRGIGAWVAPALLGAGAAVLSEYALAAAAASATLLFLRRRPRGALTLGAGVMLGYVLYGAIGRLSARATNDPDVQLEVVLRRIRGAPFRLLGAAWDCLVVSWGRAAGALRIDGESKSTLLGAVVALAVAACVARAWRASLTEQPVERSGGGMLTLVAAVVAGLVPAFLIRTFPLTRVYETRFFVPVLAFAVCATLGFLMSLTRPNLAYLPLAAVTFLCADRLILGALEEKRLQSHFDRIGETWRPLVGDESGSVVVVAPERFGMSPEETMAKMTFRWPLPQGSRLWIMRVDEATMYFGPRSGCRRPETLDRGERVIRWPWPNEPIRAVFWDASHSTTPDLEPYFRGCSAAPGVAAADSGLKP